MKNISIRDLTTEYIKSETRTILLHQNNIVVFERRFNDPAYETEKENLLKAIADAKASIEDSSQNISLARQLKRSTE